MRKNFIQETANAPGTTATISLAGAPAGRLAWISAATFSSGAQVYYFMDDGSQAEAGYGTVTAGSPNTLTRTTVLWTTALGDASPVRLNFAGSVKVYNEAPAERAPYLNAAGDLALTGNLTVQGAAGLTSLSVTNDVAVAGFVSGKGAAVVGEYRMFAGATIPSGYLLCAGQAVLRSTYAALFVALGSGSVYGAGDGSTTFNVPDARGRTLFGKDNMNGTAASRLTSGNSGVTGTTLGAAGGDERMPTHNHGVTDTGHAHATTDPGHNHSTSAVNRGAGGGSNYLAGGGTYDTAVGSIGGNTTGISVNSATTGLTVNNAGAGGSGNVPPALVCNIIIFAGV